MSSERLARTVVMLAFEGAQVLDVAGPMQILAAVNDELSSPGYRFVLLAAKKGAFATTSGIRLVADGGYAALPRRIDTLIVAGGDGVGSAMQDGALRHAIRTGAGRARRVASVCTGAFLLAEAGLLDGKRATTHWRAADQLARRFPETRVEPDAIYVRDGKFWSSAGVTAGMDLALAFVQEDFGAEMALAIARRHVIFLIRPGGQSQFSAQLSAPSHQGRLAPLLRWIPEHIEETISIELLADRAKMSVRSFARAFVKETGETPARYVERVRVDAARRLLAAAEWPVAIIAQRAGFGSEERMRRSFRRLLKVSPASFRAHFNAREAKP